MCISVRLVSLRKEFKKQGDVQDEGDDEKIQITGRED